MSYVFISYAHADSDEVEHIVSELEATQTSSPTLLPTETPVPDTVTPDATITPTQTVPPSASPTPSSTPTTTPSPTATPSPTEDSLIVTSRSQAFCRYGPSKAYLSYVDNFVGDQVVVQGRYQYGGWVWVKPVGIPASCSMAGYLMDAFVCQGGSYLKYIDDYQSTSIVITDELNTCPAGSSGKLYGVHTRGYTDPVTIIWP